MTEQQPQSENEAPSLQLSDLVLTLKLIQAIAQRGAIKANEMSEVGALYDRLHRFLTASGVIQPEQPPEEN